ncbi:MAG: hypothetical protein KH355_03065 [Clostridiales bacterium]|nr:hypothetical protein [Clostridiales bacterium]
MRSYEVKLNGKNYQLRITAGAQKELLKEKEKSFFEILFDCMTDSLNCIDVFDKALNFKGNENEIRTGEELYDEMVDAGYEGAERFYNVVLMTAKTSGIINEDQKKKLEKAMKDMNKGLYDKITDIDKFFQQEEEKGEAEGKQEISFPEVVGERK